jgi:hypothetical protein
MDAINMIDVHIDGYLLLMGLLELARKLKQITMAQQNSTNMWRIKNLRKLRAVFDNWNRLAVI